MEVDEYNFLFLGLNLPLENSSLPGVSFVTLAWLGLLAYRVQVRVLS